MGTTKLGVCRVGFPWVPWLSRVERKGPHHPSIVYPGVLGEELRLT